jgi:chromosome segregation ATPase
MQRPQRINNGAYEMNSKNIIRLFLVSALMFVFTGCQRSQQKAEEALKQQAEQNESVSKRFQTPAATASSGTPIDSALKLAQDYASLSQKYADLQAEHLELKVENGKLKERLEVLQPELIQTKKELDEANKLVVDMRLELNNWKADTLGFRDEMRAADKVQLETLLKILQTLGGEVESTKLPDTNDNSKVNVNGDPNEKK